MTTLKTSTEADSTNSDSAGLSKSKLIKTIALLSQEIEAAASAVYELDCKTPALELQIPDCGPILAKREDCSRIGSYKWRGAYYFLLRMVKSGNRGPVVAASAGNHAQGVAISANKLNVSATIFMPVTTPQLKQQAVKRLGGDKVKVRLFGDTYDQAAKAAEEFSMKTDTILVPAFDDIAVIAGQATVALELFHENTDLKRLYVPIGGGGLASGIAFVCKEILKRNCQVIGVESDMQNSMQQSLSAKQRVRMEAIDTFCDGTAVSEPGKTTFALCQKYLDRVIRVSNSDVASAIQTAWEVGRFVPEPSGALALAGAVRECRQNQNSPSSSFSEFAQADIAVVVTGCNMDFRTISQVARLNQETRRNRRYFQFRIPEQNGSLIGLLDQFLQQLNIVDFQFGKCGTTIATPVLGVEGPVDQLDELVSRSRNKGFETLEITTLARSMFRVIPFRDDLCEKPFFARVDFPNRPGALREWMRRISPITNICYFDYQDTGETEGHAFIGFEPLVDNSQDLIREHVIELELQYDSASFP